MTSIGQSERERFMTGICKDCVTQTQRERETTKACRAEFSRFRLAFNTQKRALKFWTDTQHFIAVKPRDLNPEKSPLVARLQCRCWCRAGAQPNLERVLHVSMKQSQAPVPKGWHQHGTLKLLAPKSGQHKSQSLAKWCYCYVQDA